MAGARPLRGDQVALLVEAEGGGGHATALGHLADGEQIADPERKARIALDFKFT
jgi:hypothetical protein